MANGTAALALLPPTRASKAGGAAERKPDAATAIEIGNLVAQAAILTCLGMEKYQAGQSTLSTSMQTGELIAELYTLQQSTPEFATIAIREGRRALRAALAQNATLCRRGDLDQTLDEILGWPLGVLARVIEAERAFAS